jgi:hypothetical protein
LARNSSRPSSRSSRSPARTNSHALALSAWTAPRFTPTPAGTARCRMDTPRRSKRS